MFDLDVIHAAGGHLIATVVAPIDAGFIAM